MLQRRGFAAFGVFRGVGRGSRANEIKPLPQAPIFVFVVQNKLIHRIMELKYMGAKKHYRERLGAGQRITQGEEDQRTERRIHTKSGIGMSSQPKEGGRHGRMQQAAAVGGIAAAARRRVKLDGRRQILDVSWHDTSAVLETGDPAERHAIYCYKLPKAADCSWHIFAVPPFAYAAQNNVVKSKFPRISGPNSEFPGMLSEEALGALLIARSAYIDQPEYGIPDFRNVIEAHTPEGSPERAEWLAHINPLTAAMRQEEDLPEPPGTSPSVPATRKRKSKNVAPTLAGALSEIGQRHAAIRAQRKLDMEGAAAEGDIGPARAQSSRSKITGRKPDELADQLVIKEVEKNSKQKDVTVVYCLACDHRTAYHNPIRIKEHAVSCSALAEMFPSLYQTAVKVSAERGNGNGKPLKLRTVRKEGSILASVPSVAGTSEFGSEMDVDHPQTGMGGPTTDPGTGGISQYYTPIKMTPARQAALDLALFQLVICAALPFSFVDNPWLINFLLIAVPNYITPERTSFFLRHIPEQLSAFLQALKTFLANRYYLTLSFDGWSSRAHDEIYTFHTTLPSRRSFLTTGYIFKGVSVTAAKLCDVVEKHIFLPFKATSYSAVVGDGDIGKLFKAELSLVSAISNFFGQSNLGTAQLAAERERQGIHSSIKSASETRFGTTYIQAHAVQRCIPAIVTCVANGTIQFATAATKRLLPCLTPGPAHYAFLLQLDSMVKLLEAGANGITTLEGQNTTCADVFYVWVTIAWHLEKLLGDFSSGLTPYREKVIVIYNMRFEQMMTESSHMIFLLAYFLHPFYFQNGALKLVMPSLKEGETFDSARYPKLFKLLRALARAVLKGEQTRTGKKSKADADRLTDQLVRWAVGLPPFHQRTYSSADENPLDYWKGVSRDSNADVLSVSHFAALQPTEQADKSVQTVAIIIFSIMPSELCDERTVSLLGWINAARRSSLTPEHLIACAQLLQWYKFGLSEGNYTHRATANVRVSDVSSSSTVLSTPSLFDLLNDTDIAPQDVDREALEKSLFDQPDPYDLDETDRVNAAISADQPDAPPSVQRSSTRWAVADYVRLDSPVLAKLISAGKKGAPGAPEVVQAAQPSETVENEDWDVED
ncbi:hypothetical protein B0H14DRAFT_2580442 [Mycena olivaceomarginata]|nr:hypothetical protein B0H14DRAFT_2580442 [Mycena olivaceomarginata]